MTIQPFAPLDDSTLKALRDSIIAYGVLVPVIIDQHGRIIDGHHRVEIADSLGVAYPTERVAVKDDEQAEDMAIILNAVRRHLGVEQRREMVARLRGDGHSLRAIAGAVGVSEGTVRKDIANEELRTGTQLAPERVQGLDGKERPATRPTPAPAPESPTGDATEQRTQDDPPPPPAPKPSPLSPSDQLRTRWLSDVVKVDNILTYDVERVVAVLTADQRQQAIQFAGALERFAHRITAEIRNTRLRSVEAAQ